MRGHHVAYTLAFLPARHRLACASLNAHCGAGGFAWRAADGELYGRSIADCCARAASGHVTAAPPMSAMKSRRFIFRLIQSPRRRGRATSDERCESLKINMFRMPCGLVAAWAAQHERFEGGHTAVWTRYVVVGDLDRGEVAALRPGIDGECGEAVGVGRVSHRRPGRVLLHVDRRTLACCRVGFADGGDHATLRRVEKQLVR